MRGPHSVAIAMVAGAVAVWLSASTEASNVIHMPLGDLVVRADRIVRGTVLSATEDRVVAGGSALPIVVYRIRVDESLKGAASAGTEIDVRLLAPAKSVVSGKYRRGNMLRDLPRFAVGRDYLFVLTRPSAIGLSTTVGLGQGLFELRGRPGQELAVNEANNLGLLDPPTATTRRSGPVPYDALVERIRTLLGR
jgi:hypothetical protein